MAEPLTGYVKDAWCVEPGPIRPWDDTASNLRRIEDSSEGGPDAQPVEPTDKVLPETRWVAAVIIPFLVVALLILLLAPTRTGELFAWKLQPTMSAMMLGSAYAGGVVFFAVVLAAREWHRVKAGFLPVTVFATVLGVATIMHWDRFAHAQAAFYAWAALYFTTPFIVFVVWLRNRRLDPRSIRSDDRVVPRWLRITFGMIGVTALAIAAAMFVAPEPAAHEGTSVAQKGMSA